MSTSFSFSANDLATASYLERGNLTTGSGPGVNDPTQYSGYTPTQAIDGPGDVDLFSMTMVAGQTYTFDIDNGYGDASSVDLQIDIIDQYGNLIATQDNPSSTERDPLLSFTATTTGTFYVAVHDKENDYVNGSFKFEAASGGSGTYSLVVSTPFIPPVTTLTNYAETRSFSDSSQTVKALGGSDTLYLYGGNDIAQAGDGNDLVYGGYGADEVNGGTGNDHIYGDYNDDSLYGDAGNDSLYGGSERDSVNGGLGNDLVYGGVGNDAIWGDDGADLLNGESGNDMVRGGTGVDTLYGGAGADTFHFMAGEANYDSVGFSEDRIQDFAYEDVIDLTDAAWGTLAWRGTGAFTGAYQVRVNDLRSSIGYQEVQVNLDTDSTPEMAFLVRTTGSFTLISSDFLL